jgi:hypothetical protein
MASLTFRNVSPEKIGASPGFTPEAISNSGFLIGSDQNCLYAVDLDKQTSTVLCRAPAPGNIGDAAYNPKDGAVAISLSYDDDETTGDYRAPLAYVPADPSQSHIVFCRRVDRIMGMDFDSDGNFYFGSAGDLWCGRVKEQDPVDWKYVLNAERHAPIATLETDLANGAYVKVSDVLVSGKYIYVGMSGRHWGTIVRIKKVGPSTEAPTFGNTEGGTVARYAKRSTAYLCTVEPIVDTPDKFYTICGTRDGNHVLIVTAATYEETEPDSFNALMIGETGKPTKVLLKRK